MTREEYRDIKGYEGFYQVSSLGAVKGLERKTLDGKRLKEKVLKLGLGGMYLTVNLCKEGISKTFHVHSLVATAFLGHKSSGHKVVIDHIDNNRLNNIADNLQLTTQRRNTSKDKKGCSSEYTGVSWNKQANKWISNIYINGKFKFLGVFTNEIEAHEIYQKELQTL